MPSLQDLPIELRQKIYALAVVPLDITKIATCSRPRGPSGDVEEVALSANKHGNAQSAPNGGTGIIIVSKQVSADARPILYQCHQFEFQTSRALELYLEQIGDMKQQLRHVAIATGGYEHDPGYLYGATKRSFVMLAQATSLQSFGVSHFDFCCDAYSTQPKVDFENFVSGCTLLLQAIANTRSAKGLKVSLASMLEIVKITLPECVGCSACDRSGPQHVSTKRGYSLPQAVSRNRGYGFGQAVSQKRRRCRCKCLEADRNNEELMKQFKRSVANDLQY